MVCSGQKSWAMVFTLTRSQLNLWDILKWYIRHVRQLREYLFRMTVFILPETCRIIDKAQDSYSGACDGSTPQEYILCSFTRLYLYTLTPYKKGNVPLALHSIHLPILKWSTLNTFVPWPWRSPFLVPGLDLCPIQSVFPVYYPVLHHIHIWVHWVH